MMKKTSYEIALKAGGVLALLITSACVSYAETMKEFGTVEMTYTDISNIGQEKGVMRRDPSDIIKVGDLYYVWYLKGPKSTGYEQFPDFDGLVVRIGETHLNDAPYYKGHINDKSNPVKTIIPLMQIMREEICVKRDKHQA